jgi:hypothetical protein
VNRAMPGTTRARGNRSCVGHRRENDPTARTQDGQGRFQVVGRGGRRGPSGGGAGTATSMAIEGWNPWAGAKVKEGVVQKAWTLRQPSATTCWRDSSESSWVTVPSSWWWCFSSCQCSRACDVSSFVPKAVAWPAMATTCQNAEMTRRTRTSPRCMGRV